MRSWLLLPLFVFLLLFGALWRGLSLDPQQLPSSQIGKPLPHFDLPNLLSQEPITSQALLGKICLLVVWASWCPACQEEQLFLLELAQQGILLFGLNYKDEGVSAREWLREWGNPYQAIIQDSKGQLALDLGVYGAPEIYLLDKNGIIQYRHPGALTQAIWQREFLPKIALLEGPT